MREQQACQTFLFSTVLSTMRTSWSRGQVALPVMFKLKHCQYNTADMCISLLALQSGQSDV